jgi:hypothetical protein
MEVKRIKIIPVAKVTKAVLAQTCMGVFFIRSVPGIIFAKLFLPKPPTDNLMNRRGPQFEKHWHIS